MKKAIPYSFGAKDAKVAVAQISNDKILLTGLKIKNISNYHSFEFGEKSTKMWPYFDIGGKSSQLIFLEDENYFTTKYADFFNFCQCFCRITKVWHYQFEVLSDFQINRMHCCLDTLFVEMNLVIK